MFQENVAFMCFSTSLDPAYALFEPIETAPFTHVIPMSDSQGRLVINPLINTRASTLGAVMIPATVNRELAWEFTGHLLRAALDFDWEVAFAHTSELLWPRRFFGVGNLTVPITKADFRPHITRVLDFFYREQRRISVEFRGIHDDSMTRQEAEEAAIIRLWNLSHQPVTLFEHTLPGVLEQGDLIDQLFLGVVTPQAFAQEAHNRVSLWMMEQR